MAYCSCGGCASSWRTMGCIGGTADGFICRWSSLTPCTMRAWHFTRSAFCCSTWSHILPYGLSDERWSEQGRRLHPGTRSLLCKASFTDVPCALRLPELMPPPLDRSHRSIVEGSPAESTRAIRGQAVYIQNENGHSKEWPRVKHYLQPQ